MFLSLHQTWCSKCFTENDVGAVLMVGGAFPPKVRLIDEKHIIGASDGEDEGPSLGETLRGADRQCQTLNWCASIAWRVPLSAKCLEIWMTLLLINSLDLRIEISNGAGVRLLECDCDAYSNLPLRAEVMFYMKRRCVSMRFEFG